MSALAASFPDCHHHRDPVDDGFHPAPEKGDGGFDGDHGRVPLRQGLRIHYCEGVDRHDSVCEAHLTPGLALYVFLAGKPDARLGGQPLLPDLPGGGGGAQATLIARTRPEVLERRGRVGQHTRKVAITVSADWLADSQMALTGDGLDIGAFADRHLAQVSWRPDPALTAAAARLLDITPHTRPFHRLRLESRAVDLLAETFSRLADTGPGAGSGRLRACDVQRVRRVEDFLAAAGPATPTPTLGDLAACAGVSVSTLQRLFQAVHGVSPVEFIRRRTLDLAREALLRDGISVKEAAFRAGYTSAANFSTAFRRQFGEPPGAVAQRG
jgi:AraC-like DNA-binding protein